MKKRSEKVKPQVVGRKSLARIAPSKTKQAVLKERQLRKTPTGVTDAIAKMRQQGISLRKAARETNVSPRTVIKRAASALRKNKSGRYTAKTSDRLVRSLMIPTPEGPQEISIRGLRAASLLGRYWVAVHKYYETGHTSDLLKFQDQSVTAVEGVKYPLLTDLDVLDRLGSAGVLSFESLYARGDS
jgi:hypothetical protein